jgi:hypothetical protein
VWHPAIPAIIKKRLSSQTLSLTTKIWLSIGIFVLGFILTTGMQQVQGLARESQLRIASNALFPAAQKIQTAEAAFDRMSKEFSYAVMTQEPAGLQRGQDQGRDAVRLLKELAGTGGVAPDRIAQAMKLQSLLGLYLKDS